MTGESPDPPRAARPCPMSCDQAVHDAVTMLRNLWSTLHGLLRPGAARRRGNGLSDAILDPWGARAGEARGAATEPEAESSCVGGRPALAGGGRSTSSPGGNGRPRLLVVQPDPLGELDRFSGWLSDAGLAVRVVRPFAGETLPDTLEEDGLIVLGGSMSAWHDDEYPWLADIRRLLRRAVDLSRPALGICLGGQLLAQTFGGSVSVGDPGLETGVVRIGWRPEALADPLFADLPSAFLAGAMHGDSVRTLPEAAVWLGSSDPYPHQAFRVGTCAWGVQFHPEVSLASYRTWVSAHPGDEPVDRARLRRGTADFERLDGEVATGNRVLATRFADLVRDRWRRAV